MFYRDPKTRRDKNWVDVDHERTVREFKEARAIDFTVDVSISLFGIRNLIFKAREPIVYICLTNDAENFKKI